VRTEDGYIIYRCLNGDQTAFGFLVDKYKAGVYASAYERLHNFHDAEDIAQEAFFKAYRLAPCRIQATRPGVYRGSRSGDAGSSLKKDISPGACVRIGSGGAGLTS
jgi:hypothetical protein